MNPFMLLIGPAMAVGMFIIKMFVAAGFWISNQFALLPDDGTRPGVAVYAQAEQREQPDQLLIRLPSGETFRGAAVAASALAAADTPDWGTLFAASPTPGSEVPAIVAKLASERGHTMVCILYGEPGHPMRGACKSAAGRSFDLTL